MRIHGWMCVFLVGFFYSSFAWADEIKTVEVWKNLFTLNYGKTIESNTTFLITNEGVVVVDTRVTPAEARKVKEEVRKQTQLPILYVINTHYHGDNVFGNQVFNKDSNTIIAHENVRQALENESGQKHLEFFKTLEIQGIEETVITPPNMTFKEKMHIWVGEYHLELIHMPGHTDGDLVIYIEALKTIIAGDLISNRKIPDMRDAYIENWMKALNYIGDLNAEIYIPGNGEPGGKPILLAMKHYLMYLIQKVKVEIEKGSSLKETQDVVRPFLHKKFKHWKKLEWIDSNIERVYQEFSLK